MSTLIAIQHVLTPEQIQELGNDVVYLKDVNPELFNRVANCPSDKSELYKLAYKFGKFMSEYKNGKFTYNQVVLPIGSPAFQMALGHVMEYHTNNEEAEEIWYAPKMLFSHSIRQSIDEVMPDGSIVKKSVFKHEKFIVL